MAPVKKIIIYSEKWENGGIESYLMNQLRHWDLSQIECTILSAEKNGKIYDQELSDLGIQQEILLKKKYSPIIRTLKSFVSLKGYLKSHSCDIIYFNLANCVQMRCAKIARKSGIQKVVVHGHAAGIHFGVTRGLKVFSHEIAKKIYCKYATDWWACSDKAARFIFPQNLQDRIQIIPNGIDVKRFRYQEGERIKLRKELNINTESVVIGTVGRCSFEKNQEFLLDVFFNIHTILPNCKLMIVGDGPLKSSLEEKAEKLGVKGDCFFYGASNDISSIYSLIDIFCLPSTTESFGIAALEAQAAGCVCLLADNLPCQIKILPFTQFLQLKEQLWITAIIKNIEIGLFDIQRKNVFAEVKKRGFDVSSIAPNVQNTLVNECVKN